MDQLVLYTKDDCVPCAQLKNRLKAEKHDFIEINIGRDITREEFMEKYPSVRAVPHMVVEKRGEV